MDPKRFGDLLADGHGGIERGHGVLKDHANVTTSISSALSIGQLEKILTLKPGLSRSNIARRPRNQIHERLDGHRLAAPRFTHNSERFATLDVEGHSAHCLDRAAVGLEIDGEVAYLKQRHR